MRNKLFVLSLTVSSLLSGCTHVIAKVNYVGFERPGSEGHVNALSAEPIVRKSCFDGPGNIGITGIVEKVFEENPKANVFLNVSTKSEVHTQLAFGGNNIAWNCLYFQGVPAAFK